MRLWIFSLIMCAGCFSGCTDKTKPARLHEESNPYLQQGRVQFMKSDMKHLVHVVGIESRRIEGDLLQVILTLRNRKSDDLWIECRTTFLDGDKHVLEQTNWEPIQLTSRTISEYRCTSLGKNAADYQIIMRSPAKSNLELP